VDRIFAWFTPLLLSAGLASAGLAQSYSEALVALQFADGGLYQRTAQVEKLLKKGYRFSRVRIVTNVEVHDLNSLVRRFIAQPAVTGERRVIWISAASGRRLNAPCFLGDEKPAVKPRTPLMMIAPLCFRRLVDLPPGIRHSRSAVGWADPDNDPKPANSVWTAGTFAFIALPDDHQAPVEAADRAILNRMVQGTGRSLSAYVLFETLRRRLSTDGTDFTPYLEVSKPAVAWATNLFGGNAPLSAENGTKPAMPGLETRARRVTVPKFRLRRAPDLNADALVVQSGNGPITVIRTDSSGTMAYVKTSDGRFGWIDRDLLQ